MLEVLHLTYPASPNFLHISIGNSFSRSVLAATSSGISRPTHSISARAPSRHMAPRTCKFLHPFSKFDQVFIGRSYETLGMFRGCSPLTEKGCPPPRSANVTNCIGEDSVHDRRRHFRYANRHFKRPMFLLRPRGASEQRASSAWRWGIITEVQGNPPLSESMRRLAIFQRHGQILRRDSSYIEITKLPFPRLLFIFSKASYHVRFRPKGL